MAANVLGDEILDINKRPDSILPARAPSLNPITPALIEPLDFREAPTEINEPAPARDFVSPLDPRKSIKNRGRLRSFIPCNTIVTGRGLRFP